MYEALIRKEKRAFTFQAAMTANQMNAQGLKRPVTVDQLLGVEKVKEPGPNWAEMGEEERKAWIEEMQRGRTEKAAKRAAKRGEQAAPKAQRV